MGDVILTSLFFSFFPLLPLGTSCMHHMLVDSLSFLVDIFSINILIRNCMVGKFLPVYSDILPVPMQ